MITDTYLVRDAAVLSVCWFVFLRDPNADHPHDVNNGATGPVIHLTPGSERGHVAIYGFQAQRTTRRQPDGIDETNG